MGTLGGLSEAEARIEELEQELAAAEQARDQAVREVQLQAGSFAAVVQERDAARETVTALRLHAANYVGAMVEDQNRLARLAALETAARKWGYHRAIAHDPRTEPDVYWANTQRLVQAERTLAAAVAALDAAPGKAE